MSAPLGGSLLKLSPIAGRGRDVEIAPSTRTLELVLEDRSRRSSGPDAADTALNLVRVLVSDPGGEGFYRRTMLLHGGQRTLLDVRNARALQVRFLAVVGCSDGRNLMVTPLEAERPQIAHPVFDLVEVEVTTPTAEYFTPPPGARRWWAADAGGAGVGPVPGVWHGPGGAQLTAGGVAGDVLGPVFTFDKAGSAQVIWEIVP